MVAAPSTHCCRRCRWPYEVEAALEELAVHDALDEHHLALEQPLTADHLEGQGAGGSWQRVGPGAAVGAVGAGAG